MRQAPSEALAQLPAQPEDVIVEDPGREEEEEKKTVGRPTPVATPNSPGQGYTQEDDNQPQR